MWNHYEKTRVAAVQAAPVFLDAKATTEKACDLIAQAARQGARVIALPEVYIPGYPYWSWMMAPLEGSVWFKELYRQSVVVPGPETELLGRAARQAEAFVVIGVNERVAGHVGTMYNTNLIFGPDGRLLGRHRKLVPTWVEKLSWGSGDGSSLRTYDTPCGPLGTLACGENTNTLARFALLAQGEMLHVANYIAYPFTSNYSMPEAIKIRAGAHSFEGKVHTIVSCSALTPEIVDRLCTTDEHRRLMSGSPNAYSAIFGPDGQIIGEPLIDVEGIIVQEIDPERCVDLKQYHDILGNYNRFDIFELRVNRRPLQPAEFLDPRPGEAPAGEPPMPGEADSGAGGEDSVG